MKIKRIVLWLLLLLPLFSNISFAISDQRLVSEFKKNQMPENEKYNERGDSGLDNRTRGLDQDRAVFEQVDEASKLQKKINTNKENIISNIMYIDNIKEDLKKNFINLNKANQEITTLIENNTLQNASFINKNELNIISNQASIDLNKKLFTEYLTNHDLNQSNLDKLNQALSTIDQTSGLTNDFLDRFWVLIAAVLVFFMQAGFKTFEAGMVRKVHADNVAIKNILDWLVISLVYFLLGFGLMFGDSFNGLIGTSLFGPTAEVLQNVKNNIDGQYLGLEFFLYQLAFAATAATIVSGAVSERIALIPYIVLSIFIGTLIYPVFGHWVWGGTYFLTDQGWLFAIGFRDFAGSTVVHSIGAWVALAGIMVIGARHGRYDIHGNLNRKDFAPSNLGYSTLGVLILWFGWWGFNGGSQLKYDESIASIILNTILSGSAAGITAFFHAMSRSHDKNEIFPKLLGGILGGLVAITACCNSVSAWEAIFIGAVAGFVHNYSYDYLMYKLKLDDPVGAVAVHGFCGVWGTVCVAFFGDLGMVFFVPNGGMLFSEHGFLSFLGDMPIRLKQTIIQCIGISTAFIFSFSLSFIFFKLILKIPGIGLRVLPSDEKNGSLLGISN